MSENKPNQGVRCISFVLLIFGIYSTLQWVTAVIHLSSTLASPYCNVNSSNLFAVLFIITNLLVAGVMKWVNMKCIYTYMYACIHTYINTYMHTYRYVCCCKFRCSGTGKRFSNWKDTRCLPHSNPRSQAPSRQQPESLLTDRAI